MKEQYGRKRPPRLARIEMAAPLYFVTFCTWNKAAVLAKQSVHEAFRRYASGGADRGVAVGRYVIMPDHVHLFVRGSRDFRLSYWVRGLKRVIGDELRAAGQANGIWQEGFFDHVMRSSESYRQKWEYVRRNPVRAGLVKDPDQWQFSGEIVALPLL